MADNIERKRVTLHPLKDDGTMDLNVNLYPKTFIDGIVDREGNPVEVATQEGLNTKQDILIPGDNITIENNVISASGGGSDIPTIDISELMPQYRINDLINFLKYPQYWSGEHWFEFSGEEIDLTEYANNQILRMVYYKDEVITNTIPEPSFEEGLTVEGLNVEDIQNILDTKSQISIPTSSGSGNNWWYCNWPTDGGTYYTEPDWGGSKWYFWDYYDYLDNDGWELYNDINMGPNYSSISGNGFTNCLAYKDGIGLIISYEYNEKDDRDYIKVLYWFHMDEGVELEEVAHALYFIQKQATRSVEYDDEPIFPIFEYVNVQKDGINKLVLEATKFLGTTTTFSSGGGGGGGDYPQLFFQFSNRMKEQFGDLYDAWPVFDNGEFDGDLYDSIYELYRYFDGSNDSAIFQEPNGTLITCSYEERQEYDVYNNSSYNEYFTFSDIHSDGLTWEVQVCYIDYTGHMYLNYVKVFIEGSWHYWVPDLVRTICKRDDYFSLPTDLNFKFKELFAGLYYGQCQPNWDYDVYPYVEPMDIYDGVCTSILRFVWDINEDCGFMVLDYIKGLSWNDFWKDKGYLDKHAFWYNFGEIHPRDDSGYVDWDTWPERDAIKKLNLNTYSIVLQPYFYIGTWPEGWDVFSYQNDYIEFNIWPSTTYEDIDLHGNYEEVTQVSTLPYMYYYEDNGGGE